MNDDPSVSTVRVFVELSSVNCWDAVTPSFIFALSVVGLLAFLGSTSRPILYSHGP